MAGAFGIRSSWFHSIGSCITLLHSFANYYLAHILKKRLDGAIVERNAQHESFGIFTDQQGQRVQQWMETVLKWEATHKGNNPYEVPQDGAYLVFLCKLPSKALTYTYMYRAY